MWLVRRTAAADQLGDVVFAEAGQRLGDGVVGHQIEAVGRQRYVQAFAGGQRADVGVDLVAGLGGDAVEVVELVFIHAASPYLRTGLRR